MNHLVNMVYLLKELKYRQIGRGLHLKSEERARFSDGTKVTPMDVKFRLKPLCQKDILPTKNILGSGRKVDVIGKNEVKFHFKGDPNPELSANWISITNFFKK